MTAAISPPSDVARVVEFALAEDIGSGDITAQLIAADQVVTAKIVAREMGIFCGSAWVEEIFRQLPGGVQVDWLIQEGEPFQDQQKLASLRGPARSIMTGERTVLNFLQTLCATASQTRQLVDLVSHTGVKILDTRKTLPGLRRAQKYAVTIGGGHNHRMGLFDAYLIKENHIAACGGIAAAIGQARALQAGKAVEIEVQDLAQLQQALDAGADTIMLDNFELELLQQAVAINQGHSRLEASGGIDQDSLVKIAATGVDYISIGAMTKHCKAIDLSLLLE